MEIFYIEYTIKLLSYLNYLYFNKYIYIVINLFYFTVIQLLKLGSDSAFFL